MFCSVGGVEMGCVHLLYSLELIKQLPHLMMMCDQDTLLNKSTIQPLCIVIGWSA